MAKKTPVDRLSAEISRTLSEYGDEVAASMNAIVRKVAQSGAKALRTESKQKFPHGSGAYAKGWRSKVDTNKRTAQGTIYNEDLPGLPHLLEHGHANRGGGRTPGRVHIKTIEDEIIKDFEKEVRSKL